MNTASTKLIDAVDSEKYQCNSDYFRTPCAKGIAARYGRRAEFVQKRFWFVAAGAGCKSFSSHLRALAISIFTD
jgi:hypothetical protein